MVLISVICTENERGLGGIVVHPSFALNHYVYLYYTYQKFGTCNLSDVDGPVNRLIRYTLSDDDTINPASGVVLVDTPSLPDNLHNGGDLEFRRDGYLYVTVGDGGTAGVNRAQNLGWLFSKILRLTESGGIPQSNPFTGLTVPVAI